MTGAARLDLPAADRRLVLTILAANLPAGTAAWVFGSRATGRARRYSDLDLAIDAGGDGRHCSSPVYNFAAAACAKKRWAIAACIAMPTAMLASFRIMRLEWQGATGSFGSRPSGITPRNIMQPGMRCNT